ncbi:accessory Sec system translocase SecA2 [Rossellomorea vietnamensis]|uniref:Protein translocase subunit SecA n=1 Tax=Rossellomorea vietnamensis TaxID=218284 RepID=A0A5D4KGL5_9BACI|nr:accessory Sec system translocase SecA2 [Rossellomorea vietnamensis]TYR76019.1 accessory Sec system translocase SecA2 [Rossellomorea vietnamensis]
MIKLLTRATDNSYRYLRRYFKMVNEINSLEDKYKSFTDQQLQNMTNVFKELLQSGKSIEDITIDAFAVVREASKRVLNMRPYDVQLIGGLAIVEGNISEMATGEGKTLVASFPTYVRALEGKGVHVITVNEYLARRDKEKIGKIHEFLGLSVGLNVPNIEPEQKKQSYLADITYGLGTEFGFDFLRDNMCRNSADKVQRPYHYAIIDEIDSVLIDEAKTPLIIAGKVKSSKNLYFIASKLAKRFEVEVDFEYDEETKATSLTDTGIEKVEKAFGVDNLYDLEHQTLYHYVIQAVRANVMFHKDVDYIVQDGEIKLVDMFTGRIMEGRSLSDGLHQALESKEGVEITPENKTQAQITIQNYFRMYPTLSGMTGTAKTEEKEFREVYGMEVVQIPTNKPKIRTDLKDKVYKYKAEKYKELIEQVNSSYKKGQPVLIGTTSILQSEQVAGYLTEAGLPFELLNAKSVEQEVQLISNAGQRGQITIATNMAGRGTDIMLGEGVPELGGLHVIGTEKHESRRIDNQLRGRSGRQGDPGSTQFIISLEDDMFRRYAKDDLYKMEKKLKLDSHSLVLNNNISEFVERTQRIVEGANYSYREYNLKLDDVINEQRNIIYDLRNKLLTNNKKVILNTLRSMLTSTIDNIVNSNCSEELLPEEWQIERILNQVNELLTDNIVTFKTELLTKEDVLEPITPALNSTIENITAALDTENVLDFVKHFMIGALDKRWTKHIENMNRLKEGIGLRYYQQEDPMRIYQREGLELFTDAYHSLEYEISINAVSYIKQASTISE